MCLTGHIRKDMETVLPMFIVLLFWDLIYSQKRMVVAKIYELWLYFNLLWNGEWWQISMILAINTASYKCYNYWCLSPHSCSPYHDKVVIQYIHIIWTNILYVFHVIYPFIYFKMNCNVDWTKLQFHKKSMFLLNSLPCPVMMIATPQTTRKPTIVSFTTEDKLQNLTTTLQLTMFRTPMITVNIHVRLIVRSYR